jgi:hypothetical protein
MLQRAFIGILIPTAVAISTISSAWADDLPPYFSTLEFSAEQTKSLAQIANDHSALPSEDVTPETERAFFTDCWRVLTEDQRAAWNKAARVTLVVPKEWNALELSEFDGPPERALSPTHQSD